MNLQQKNHLSQLIQAAFPITKHPYRDIAEIVDIPQERVMAQIQQWKDHEELREISGIMEGGVLGYDSALVCCKVAPEKLPSVAGIISQHPTITHNYERNHQYNLWFTLAVPESQGLQAHLNILSQLTGVYSFHILKRTHTFKIGVVFDFQTKKNHTPAGKLPQTIQKKSFTERDARIIRALQADLPVCESPFAILAEKNDLQESELFEFAGKEMGNSLRRYCATFRHRKMGIQANGMVVWNIDDALLLSAGQILAAESAVSHCYARNRFDGFPYNLYSMFHAADRKSLEASVEPIAKNLSNPDFLILESPTEFKKVRLRYFLKELDEWWEKYHR